MSQIKIYQRLSFISVSMSIRLRDFYILSIVVWWFLSQNSHQPQLFRPVICVQQASAADNNSVQGYCKLHSRSDLKASVRSRIGLVWWDQALSPGCLRLLALTSGLYFKSWKDLPTKPGFVQPMEFLKKKLEFCIIVIHCIGDILWSKLKFYKTLTSYEIYKIFNVWKSIRVLKQVDRRMDAKRSEVLDFY